MSHKRPDWYDPKLYRRKPLEPTPPRGVLWSLALFLAIASATLAALYLVSRFA